MIRIRFPKVDANVLEGQVGVWLKAEGEPVEKEEPLVELITDKATFELPAEEGGVLRRIIAAEKSVIPVNYVIALVGGVDEPVPDVAEENRRIVDKHLEEMAALNAAKAADKGAPSPARKPKKKVRATPAARRAAREAGIDLVDVSVAEDVKIVTEDHVRAHLAAKEGASG